MSSSITLRRVVPDDLAFLKRVYASTREEELARAPWSADQKAAFLEMQFEAQQQDYHRNYPDASFDVIVRAGVSLGRFYVLRRPKEISIIDIALLPEYRGAGVGGALLHQLIEEADDARKPLSIYVEKDNRAQTLYRRLGFLETDDTGIYWRMVRPVQER